MFDGRERGARHLLEQTNAREKTATDLSVWTLVSLCACTCRAVLERDVQSPDVRSRERTCPCLHKGWRSPSRSCLLSGLVWDFLLACGALCGVATTEGRSLPLSTLRQHTLHTREEVGEEKDA